MVVVRCMLISIVNIYFHACDVMDDAGVPFSRLRGRGL